LELAAVGLPAADSSGMMSSHHCMTRSDFEKEPVSADVHAVAFVLDGAADAADGVGGFEDDGLDSCAAQQFERSG
jgi:hypothetical protein